MTETEFLHELDREMQSFQRKTKERLAEIDGRSSSSVFSSQIRGELKHRAVIIRNMLSQYRRGEW